MRNGLNGVADKLKAEAIRYFHNAQGTVRKSKIVRGRFYQDTKYVVEASGTLWIAILKAIRAYLLTHGVAERSLPNSKEAYSSALKEHSTHNGKLLATFEDLYHIVHLDGYYRGVSVVENLKEGFQRARQLIEILTDKKI
ncbi:DUF5618 family protein [Candidatus Peregrinibacteria bacterium]|nr:DUF5618 family protein [Candidatus Peregrinibacteria bacterium]